MELVLATHNKNKLKEMQELMSDAGVKILSLTDIGFTEDIIEDGETFEENARIKARTISALGYIAVADDSGLCVDALGGRPGVYSARYAGEPCDYSKNNALLLSEMENVPEKERTAHFITVIVLSFPDGREIVCEGKCDGVILREKRGGNGFGYDPLFYVPDFDKTFAELSSDEKNSVSHRGRAMRELKRKISLLPPEKESLTLGIYGGTFSPPHRGHLHAVNSFLNSGLADILLVIPSFIPPHKVLDEGDNPSHRLEMTKLMLKSHPEYEKRLFVCDWEIEQKNTSYTVNTLEYFSKFYSKMTLLIGTDMLLTLDKWKSTDRISSLAEIAFIPRENPTPELQKKIENKIKKLSDEYGTKIKVLDFDAIECSSTMLREKIRRNEDTSDFLCREVKEYINENKLYRF